MDVCITLTYNHSGVYPGLIQLDHMIIINFLRGLHVDCHVVVAIYIPISNV